MAMFSTVSEESIIKVIEDLNEEIKLEKERLAQFNAFESRNYEIIADIYNAEEEIRIWNKVLQHMAGGSDALAALALTIVEVTDAVTEFQGDTSSRFQRFSNENALRAKQIWLRKFHSLYPYIYYNNERLTKYVIFKAYVREIERKRRIHDREMAKRKKEHERTYGTEVNEYGKSVTWQGVRKVLRSDGFDLATKDDAYGVRVTKNPYNGAYVSIVRKVTKYVDRTDEELIESGYKLIDDMWSRKNYWGDEWTPVTSGMLLKTVPDDDAIAALKKEYEEVKAVLISSGYVCHDYTYNNYKTGDVKIEVTGWKVQ